MNDHFAEYCAMLQEWGAADLQELAAAVEAYNRESYEMECDPEATSAWSYAFERNDEHRGEMELHEQLYGSFSDLMEDAA